MKTFSRTLWLITLLFFVSGCSGYRVTWHPDSANQEQRGASTMESCPIEQGDFVTVILTAGDRIEGKVELISPREIVLDCDEKSLQPRGFAMDQIQSIEKIKDSPTATAFVGVALVLAIGGGIIAYHETASLRDGFMGK